MFRPTVAGVLVVLTATSAGAWQHDVHYGLTRWLAMKAGFSPQHAAAISEADQGLDDSSHANAIPTVLMSIVRTDKVAAADVRDKHFPSDAIVPNPPPKRTVTKNGPAARRAAEDAARATSAQNALERFGAALHPLQDSWSHAGVPDSPIRPGFQFQRDYSFAHPADRGGWCCHDADLTFMHERDTLETAKATYELMLAFLAKNERFRTHGPAAWDTLVGSVKAFANARTKDEKRIWYEAQNMPTDTWPLSLPGSVTASLHVRAFGRPGASAMLPNMIQLAALGTDEKESNAPPDELVGRAGEFLRLWLRARNIPDAVSMMHYQVMREQFRGFRFPGSVDDADRETVAQWCRKFLTMYLVADHGHINELGHCDPTRKGYVNLPETPTGDGPLRPRTEVSGPEISVESFVPVGQQTFALVLTFDELPHDGVIVVWQRREGRWGVVSMIGVNL
jgi:hypothetical protein